MEESTISVPFESEVIIPESKTDKFIKIIDSLFRKSFGAGIIFYSLYFIYSVATMKGATKDIKMMILTFAFSLISLVAGFYYGSAHAKLKGATDETT